MTKKENPDFAVGDKVYVTVRTSPYTSFDELRIVTRTTPTTVITGDRSKNEHVHRKTNNGGYRNLRKATDFELATEEWWKELRKMKYVIVDHGFDRRISKEVKEIVVQSPGSRHSGLLRVEHIDAAIAELAIVRDLLAARPKHSEADTDYYIDSAGEYVWKNERK